EIANFKSIRHLELQFDQTETPLPEVVGVIPIDESLAGAPGTPTIAAPRLRDGLSGAPVLAHAPTPLKAGWKVLLGENGVGKSSILQAAAFALAGEREVLRRVPGWDKFLRRARGKRLRPKAGF